jgi:transcriptional regulator with XRE-family HTH domain
MARQRRDTPRDALIRYFGKELRAEREAAGLSQPQLAEALGCTHQWIGKVERGESAPSDEFAEDLETFFKASGRYRRLRKEIRDAHRNQVLLPGFAEYLILERRSVRMRSFHAQLIPGLLQDEGYLRRLMATRPDLSDTEELVDSRLERQALLAKERPLSAWFVLDEATLRRQIGTQEDWKAQLERLTKASEMPNVRIWVLPFSSVTYAALSGKFTLLTLDDGKEVAYLEGPNLSLVSDDPDMIADCALRFDLIMGEALRSAESLKLIKQIMEDFA